MALKTFRDDTAYTHLNYARVIWPVCEIAFSKLSSSEDFPDFVQFRD